MENKFESLIRRLEVAVSKLEGVSTGSATRGPAGDSADQPDASASSPSYMAYCDWVKDFIDPFCSASDELGEC